MFFVLVPVLFCNFTFYVLLKKISRSINTHTGTGRGGNVPPSYGCLVPWQPYEGCTYCFIHEVAHTNVRFISCAGHQLYERGVDLEVEGVRYIEQRSRTRRRSQCMPRRV